MKETNEVTRRIQEKLVECPNCGYRLTQKTSYSLICKVCGIKIHVETRKERVIIWGALLAVVCFALGLVITLIRLG